MIRTHIVVLGAAVALFAASEAIAQAPARPDSAGRQGEMRRGQRPRGERGMRMGREGMRGLLRGIELTQAQRDQVKTINEKYRAEFQTLRESLEPDMKAVRDARQRGDTAAARAAWDRNSAGREKMQALMAKQRAELRGVLTPEQQKTFDANVQQVRERGVRGPGKARHRAGRRTR